MDHIQYTRLRTVNTALRRPCGLLLQTLNTALRRPRCDLLLLAVGLLSISAVSLTSTEASGKSSLHKFMEVCPRRGILRVYAICPPPLTLAIYNNKVAAYILFRSAPWSRFAEDEKSGLLFVRLILICRLV